MHGFAYFNHVDFAYFWGEIPHLNQVMMTSQFLRQDGAFEDHFSNQVHEVKLKGEIKGMRRNSWTKSHTLVYKKKTGVDFPV